MGTGILLNHINRPVSIAITTAPTTITYQKGSAFNNASATVNTIYRIDANEFYARSGLTKSSNVNVEV